MVQTEEVMNNCFEWSQNNLIDQYNAEDYEKPSLLDKYEYAMHGKVFKVEEKKEKKE